MKKNVLIARHFAFALLLVALTAVSMPQNTWAQRASTDKGKVTTQRGKTKAAPRSATKKGKATAKSSERASKARSRDGQSASRSSKSGSDRASKARSGVSRGSDSGSSRSDSRTSGATGSDRRSSAATRSGSRGNATNSGARAGSRDAARQSQSAGARSGGVRSGGVRSSGTNDRTVINGNRSRQVIPRQAPRVDGKRRYSVRFAPKVYVNARPRIYHRSPRISVHIAWPWVVRYERRWSPRYRYRQVVYVESRWGQRDRRAQVEMETTYKHRVKFATDDYAVLDIEIEEVALYEDGRFLGTVDRIPGSLSNVEATVYRDGRVTFDRDVFIVGDRRAGFEMISTRFYDDYALARYNSSDGYRVGSLNLRTGKVSVQRRSRLFDPRDYNGFAPISLLPEEEGWLWDYGVDAISAASDDYDAYYGYNSGVGLGYRSGNPLSSTSDYSYSTDFGAQFSVKRQSNIQRVE